MINQDTKQDLSYYEELTDANPLQKQCLKKPLSIFPFIELPQFKYNEIEADLQSGFKQNYSSPQKNIRSRSLSPKKLNKNLQTILQLNQTQLSVIFKNPIFCYNKRLCHGTNKNFCNMRVFQQESHDHPIIKDNYAQFYKKSDEYQNLQFQSRFQSGNLGMATPSFNAQNQYYLLLTKDFNTALCTQWFFFRILNKKKAKCTFHILNFFKNYSSFEYGMQLCVASKSNKFVWKRGGTNIKYRKTSLKFNQRTMYALSFNYEFDTNQDMTFFSYSYPYTFSKLDKFLFSIETQNSCILKRRSIGTSSGGIFLIQKGNNIEMITITNFKISQKDKKIVFITSRVHPGQTPSSFVMEGIINKLLQNNQQMQNARQKFIFRLVPMLNPDGVINGNYRCGLSGYDLNRIWNLCSKDKYPEIFSIKNVLKNTKKPFCFIDLHAHSKKKGAFIYGCSIKNNPFLCREIPFLFWKNIKQFNYYQCNFSIKNKNRDGTARMSLFKQFGINLSYTMQHSFCGPLKQKKQFSPNSYKQIGQNIVLTLQKYYGRRRNKSNSENQFPDYLKELYQNKELIKVGQNDQNQSSSDSQLEAEFQIQDEHKNTNRRQSKLRNPSKIMIEPSNDLIKTPRQKIFNNFTTGKINSYKQKSGSQLKLINRRSHWQHQLAKMVLIPDQATKQPEQSNKNTDLNLQQQLLSFKRDEQNSSSKRFLKSGYRYSEDQVNDLTNLFLPSVRSSSYKRYNKPRNQFNGMIHVGRKLLENAGILKQQIKSVNPRKIQWKTIGKTYL